MKPPQVGPLGTPLPYRRRDGDPGSSAPWNGPSSGKTGLGEPTCRDRWRRKHQGAFSETWGGGSRTVASSSSSDHSSVMLLLSCGSARTDWSSDVSPKGLGL